MSSIGSVTSPDGNFSINSIATLDGEPGRIWGGLGADVGPRQIGDQLGGIGASYVISCGDSGSLTLVQVDRKGGEAVLQVNSATWSFQLLNPVLDIEVLDDDTVQITPLGEAPLQFPTLRGAFDTGPIVQLVISLVSTAPVLQSEWNTDAMQLLSDAGYPDSALQNLDTTVSGAQSGSDQFAAWLQTVDFSSTADLSEEAYASMFSCVLCKAMVVGGAVGVFVFVAAACIAAGPASFAAAVAAVMAFDATAALAGLAAMTVYDTAVACTGAFFSVGAGSFVGQLLNNICTAMGACGGGGGMIAPPQLAVRTAE